MNSYSVIYECKNCALKISVEHETKMVVPTKEVRNYLHKVFKELSSKDITHHCDNGEDGLCTICAIKPVNKFVN